MNKGVGKPKVGGPFVLTDLEGKVFTEEELRGRYSFVCFPLYFFFTREGEKEGKKERKKKERKKGKTGLTKC